MKLRCTPALVAAGLALLSVPTSGLAQQAERDVRLALTTFFDALRAKDEDGLRSTTIPETRIFSIREVEGSPTLHSASLDDLIRRVMESEATLDERDFNVKVRVLGDLATVEQRFNMYIDGTLHHCGVEAIDLFRSSTGWKMVHVSEIITERGCTPEAPA